MNLSKGSTKKKSYLYIWLLFLMIIVSLCFILSLLVNPLWWILFPISLFLIIIFQLMSRYFWLEKKTCPRCNAPVSKYGESCRKCGLKLWFKCLSCGKYMRVDTKFCDNCNIELEHTIEEREIFKYKASKKSSPLPEKPNFCSNCGIEIKNPETIKYCEECGEKI
ncbi:MAG: zinc ribbon domain-containing protein [Candidatus Hodarchaeota archaeon]